ncbi:MAG: hypothetical protein NTZ56_14945 [Acidobacteria bacterium]|nr:hypothetical protein [Acidobacteriota bacterium]
MTRRESLGAIGVAAFAAPAPPTFDADLIRRHDGAVDSYLKNQVTAANSPWRGALPDAYGLHAPGTAAGLWDVFTAAYVCPQSRHHRKAELLERIALAAGFLERSMSPEGNIYLPITNFNSPPDSAFAVRSSANTVLVARQNQATEILRMIEPLVKRMADAIAVGGIHTPNHRWVVSAALAQAHELWPEPQYLRRIDQWLAEGFDIDPDGQWSERSTVTYNTICDQALTVLAHKLKRPEYLEPVRKNLESMLYLIHADGEVDTSFSRRQDAFTRGTMAGYWFPLQYLAVKQGDGRFGNLAMSLWPKAASLSLLMTYPELNRRDLKTAPLPENYAHEMPHNQVARIRRGLASVTIHTGGRDRVVSLRNGDAVINAIRFASAFFGKGQFVPQTMTRTGAGYTMTQQLEAPYYQPFTPTRVIGADEWDQTQKLRPQTQVGRLTQSATVTEIPNGLRVEIVAEGTSNVPVAVEINMREGGKVSGTEGSLLTAREGVFTLGPHAIKIKGGGCDHRYLEIRGARPPLPGPSVYVTGFTPFRRVLEFSWS